MGSGDFDALISNSPTPNLQVSPAQYVNKEHQQKGSLQ